jgi:hypothetical protein
MVVEKVVLASSYGCIIVSHSRCTWAESYGFEGQMHQGVPDKKYCSEEYQIDEE